MPVQTENLSQKVLGGVTWVMLEQCCVQGLNFVLGIILARLLTPQDYGAVAIVMVFLNVAMVVVASGFGQALVQKRDADQLDFSSVFYVSLAVALFLYAVMFFAAPFVAAFYGNQELSVVLRILAVNLVFYAVNSVQSAEILRDMRFDLSFRISLVVAITSAIVGIAMAVMGLGVWALVWSSVLASVAGVIARWIFIRWKPRLEFSLARVAPLYRFGWRLMASQLVYVGMNNLHGVVIGRIYTGADLAFVNKANNLPEMIKNNLNASLIEVSFPALAKMNDDLVRLLESLRRLLVMNVAVVGPFMVMLALTARDCILLLYGVKWLPCVPYMRLFCMGAAISCLGGVNVQSATATGRSDLVLKMVIVKSALSLGLLVAVLPHGVLEWTCSTAFVYWPVVSLLDMCIGRMTVGYRLRRQLADVLPPIATFLSACGIGMSAGYLLCGDSVLCIFARLLVEWGVAFVAYVALAVLLRLRVAKEIVSLIAGRLGSRNGRWQKALVFLDLQLGADASKHGGVR